MHVKTNKLTFLGLLLALAILLQLLGTYIESSTLFFLAASSFCLGVAIYESDLRLGLGFLIGALALSFILSPNKFYCLTYAGFCIYIYFIEFLRKKILSDRHRVITWIVKFTFYNLCFVLPTLLFFKDYLFIGDVAGKMTWNVWLYIGVFLVAQLFLVIFDWAYRRFVPAYWTQLKNRLHIQS